MNVLIIGSGGREHALCWLIKKSPYCSKIFTIPGNAGTASLGENIQLKVDDFKSIGQVIREKAIDFVIAGPEEPIVKGIEAYFSSTEYLKKVLLLAPSAEGAMLEGSKDYAKNFMERNSIPTASYRTFTKEDYQAACDYIGNHALPLVVKADGLAAGKGVTVASSYEEALSALYAIFINEKFGNAGNKVVIEQYLDGIELSVFILTDGENYILLPEAKDYKRVGEGDTGPNTGGMGSISPVFFADQAFMNKVRSKIIEPTLKGLQTDGIAYKGFIFFGLMNVKNEPYVIEYNVRLGDPETEAILPRIDEDFLLLMKQAAEGHLKQSEIKIKRESSATVMLVSGGYPEEYEKNKRITGLEMLEQVTPFIAGANANEKHLVTTGGRVIALNALGNDLNSALSKIYSEINKIKFDNMYYRKDIGQDVINLRE